MENSGRPPGGPLQKRTRRLSSDLGCFSHRAPCYALTLKAQRSFLAELLGSRSRVSEVSLRSARPRWGGFTRSARRGKVRLAFVSVPTRSSGPPEPHFAHQLIAPLP